jgi:hypothetical protein
MTAVSSIGRLLRRQKLARKPTKRFIGFQRTGPLAIEALERAQTFPAWWERKHHSLAALGAVPGLVELSPAFILPTVLNPVNFRVRPQRWKTKSAREIPVGCR